MLGVDDISSNLELSCLFCHKVISTILFNICKEKFITFINKTLPSQNNNILKIETHKHLQIGVSE